MINERKGFNWEILSLTRFILAFIVVARHACVEFTNNLGPLELIQQFGAFEAVMGFLLISGLSIGKSIVKNRDDYFIRRVQRIYPVYIATIFLSLLFLQVPIDWKLIGTLIVNLLFLNQVLVNTSFIGPAWTLALEVWLYCLAPVFLKLSYRTLIRIIYFSFSCYVVYWCCRPIIHLPYYAGTMFGLNIILLSFIWVAGFALARFPASHAKIANHIAVLFVVHFLLRHLIQFAFSLKHHQLEQWFRNDLIGIIFSGICLGATYYVIIHNNKIPVFNSKWKKLFNLLGNISYPLYLIHSTLIKFCKEMNINNWILLSLVCITGAWVIYYFFDFYSKKREIKTSTLATLKSVEV